MNECEYSPRDVMPKVRDISVLGLLKEIADNTEGGMSPGAGILVAVVNENSTMPTTRPDGTPLENEDYVKPDPDANFPFTIDGITFENKFSKAIWFNDEWIVDAGMIQDTSETPLANKTRESFETTRSFQSQLNEDIIYQLKNTIIECSDLDTVPSNRLYKRIYRQTTDTDNRAKGLYVYNFATNEWEPLGGTNIDAGNLLPSGKYEGELFILLQDVPGAVKTKRGFYRFDGNRWVHIAHTEPYTSEIEVKDTDTESISKEATTQQEINQENAFIIGQEREIDVADTENLIDAVNWLNIHKMEQKRLVLADNGDIKDEEGNVLTLAQIKEMYDSKAYWLYLEAYDNIYLPQEPTDDEMKFFGDFVVEENYTDDSTVRVESFAEVSVRSDNKGHFSDQENETIAFKVDDIEQWLLDKDTYTYPEKFYPTVQAIIDYNKAVINVEDGVLPTEPKDKYIYHFTTDIGDYKAGYYGYYDGEYNLLGKDNIVKVDVLPEEIQPLTIYELTVDTDDYDKGVYYPVIIEDELHWWRLDNVEGWLVKDSVMEIEKGEETEGEDTRIDKLKLTVTNDKDEEIIKTETDLDIKFINIYHFDDALDQDIVYEYEFHAKERETKTLNKGIKFSSPTPFKVTSTNPTYLQAGDGSAYADASNGVNATKEGDSYVVYVRGNENLGDLGQTKLQFTGSNISVAGDLRELLCCENPDDAIIGERTFARLFEGNDAIVDASGVVFPDTCAGRSYEDMFAQCSNLVSAPATIPNVNGYQSCVRMFYMCTSLVNPPTLPATQLATYCYYAMFNGCSSLVTAPNLPATNVPEEAYALMFAYCTSLTTIQDTFPATDYGAYACTRMFDSCSSLTHLPNIFAAKRVSNASFSFAFANTPIRIYNLGRSGYNRRWRFPVLMSRTDNWYTGIVDGTLPDLYEGSYYYTND